MSVPATDRNTLKTDAAPCKVLLIYPQFVGGSFWNYRDTCELIGAKYPAPPLGLITVAAMLPASWDIRLVDRNVEELHDADIAWADLIMTGGMLPQQYDVMRIVGMAHAAGKPVAIGGPDVTSSPELYESADFRILGEAEGILDEFLSAWERGERAGTFEAPKFQADVTTSPVPRFDLLTFHNYVQVNVQYSRGCPFTCEFCDIIELYGRKPRTKKPEQVLAELDRLYELGYRGHVDFVDDNLIGNKKAVKLVLPRIAEWQKKKGYPFEFSTEASLNLADDAELLGMMKDAMFFAVFVGIESPDPDVLNATRKKQNTRRDIAESVHAIYGAGMFVLAGFIVGFDEESDRVADGIVELIEDAAIPVCMVGLLYALPNTQLTRRLHTEGRLHADHDVVDQGDPADQCTAGLNFDTVRPRGKVLADYRDVVDRVYSQEAYFGRVRKVAGLLDMSGPSGGVYMSTLVHETKQLIQLMVNTTLRQPRMRGAFWRTLIHCIVRNPRTIRPVAKMLALYAHLGPFAGYVSSEIETQIADVEAGVWQPPERLAS